MNENEVHDYLLWLAGGVTAFWAWLTAQVLALKQSLADTKQDVAVVKAENLSTIDRLEDIKEEQKEFRREVKDGLERLHSRISAAKGGV